MGWTCRVDAGGWRPLSGTIQLYLTGTPLYVSLETMSNSLCLNIKRFFLCGQILENWVLQNRDCKNPRTIMLVWDTGASYGLTPFRSDFNYYVKFGIHVKDVNKVNRFIVIGTTINGFININGQDILFPCISYQPTETYVCLFSPQPYHQTTGGQYLVQGNQVTMHLPFHSTHIHVDLGDTNLPVVHNSFVTEHQKREICPQMRF